MPYTSPTSSYPVNLITAMPPQAYTTPYGYDREFLISVTIPVDAALASAPLVIWSHGNANGADFGERIHSDWAQVYSRNGYIVIMISHTRPGVDGDLVATEEEINAIRTHMLAPVTGDPTDWKFMNYLRLLDIKHVVSQLALISRNLEKHNNIAIDLDAPYALAGHSAGSGAAITYAGASRYWTSHSEPPLQYGFDTEPEVLDYKLPGCYLCYSVQPPMATDHLCAGSWLTVRPDVPVITLSGEGDTTNSIRVANTRQAAFREMITIPGVSNKYSFWLNVAGPKHGFYNHKLPGTPAFAPFETGIESVSLAFLDHFMKGLPAADAFLNSPAITVDLGADVNWQRR